MKHVHCAFAYNADVVFSDMNWPVTAHLVRDCVIGYLRALLLVYSKVAVFEKELAERISHPTCVLKHSDLRAEAMWCTSSTAVVTKNWLRFPGLIFKLQLQRHTSHTAFVLKSCSFQSPAAEARSLSTFALKSCDFSRHSWRNTLRVLLVY